MSANKKLLAALYMGIIALAPLALGAQAPREDSGTAGGAQTQRRGSSAYGDPTECMAPCDPYKGMKKLLVIADVQTGFQHDSINHMMGVIEEMGRKTGIYVTFLRTDSQLVTFGPVTASSKRYAGKNTNYRNLDYFDAVMFLGAGEGGLSAQQKADLIAFVHDRGKGLVLGHAQGVDFYNWPEWGDMTGGFMKSEFPSSGMWAKVTDPSWKAAAAFGVQPFFWQDQWPVLQPQFNPGSVHTIIALDPSQMTPQQRARRTDDYFPIVWAKYYGKGRVFNFTGDHNDATIDQPRTRALLLEGIEWAFGMTNENAEPDKK